MTQESPAPPTPAPPEDLALLTQRFFRRCLNELELPPTLAERMAGDFYQQMSAAIITNLWSEPESDLTILTLLGGGPRQ